ncbi:hypothetical protein ACFYXH_32895 [Streptomyces sp. NPDC002730]|uniref:hypothetical protein n=1 Tax=Streptomyces sp. NPDC002730 TaxID=3364662 RepID=UPI0036ADA9EF
MPARRVRPRQLVEVRASTDSISLHLLAADTTASTLLAVHLRAKIRGSWVVDEAHCDGLPDGHTRAVTTGDPSPSPRPAAAVAAGDAGVLAEWLAGIPAAQVTVGPRPLSVYEALASVTPITKNSEDTTA